MTPGHVAIAGAGPAGLVAAVAARRLGLEVDLFEQAAGPRPAGSGLFLHSNGQRVLAALGLLADLEPAMRPSQIIAIDLADGRRLSTFDYGRLDIPFNRGAVLLRRRLQEHLLAAAAAAGARLHFGCRALGVRPGTDGTGARLLLAGGGELACGAVIGADGIDSALRDDAAIPTRHKASGEAYVRGVVARATADDTVREIWGPDGRRFGICPLPGALTYFYASVPRDGWDAIRTGGLAGWIDGWSGHGPEVRSLLAAVTDWIAVICNELREVEAQRWVRPPLFLVGDAAHAMLPNLGQGANSAMVDALVAVRLLAPVLAAGGDLEAAGRAYEELRRPFVRSIQIASRRLGAVAADAAARERFIAQASQGEPLPAGSRDVTAGIPSAGYNPREEAFLAPLV